MSAEYMDSSLGYYTDGLRILRKGQGILPWKKNLNTRLHTPLVRKESLYHVAINPAGKIDRRTTGQLFGILSQDDSQVYRLVEFQDRHSRPIDTVGVPVFANEVDPIETEQTFRGFELTLGPAGQCALYGLGVELEPIEINSIQPDHVRRFTKALTDGAKTHLGVAPLKVQSIAHV